MTLSPILTVKDLVISTSKESKKFTLVDNLSFELLPSEILSIVGESGSGKSITAKSILGLLPKNFSVSGEIKYYDKNLVDSCSDNTNLDGFFQTEKYFENIADELSLIHI